MSSSHENTAEQESNVNVGDHAADIQQKHSSSLVKGYFQFMRAGFDEDLFDATDIERWEREGVDIPERKRVVKPAVTKKGKTQLERMIFELKSLEKDKFEAS